MTPHSQINWFPALRVYLITSAMFHFVWEGLQLPLYAIWNTGTTREIAFAVLHCTVGDLMIASLSLLVALLVVGNPAWPSERFVAVMVTTIGIGIGYTVYSEWTNTVVRKTWTYSGLMPIVPFLGAGLSPFMQWLIVPTVGFMAVRHRYKLKLGTR